MPLFSARRSCALAVSALLCAIVLSACASSPPAVSLASNSGATATPGRFTNPNIEVVGGAIEIQKADNWCWAACARHVLLYRGRDISQEQIAGLFTGGVPLNRPAQMSEIVYVLNWAGMRAWAVGRPASPQELMQTLHNGYKLIVLIDPRATGVVGHFVVVEGIGPNGGIVVSDPLDGSTREYPLGSIYASRWMGSVVVG